MYILINFFNNLQIKYVQIKKKIKKKKIKISKKEKIKKEDTIEKNFFLLDRGGDGKKIFLGQVG